MTKEQGPAGTAPLVFRTASLSARKPTRFAFHPDTATRAAMSAALGLLDLPSFDFRGEIRPVGRHDFELTAALSARAVQPCSVTLAPVPCTITEAVRRRYDAAFAPPEAEEVEMTDDEVEAMPEVIDIAAVATEALALALPLYPRAPGAALGEAVFAQPGVAPISDGDLKPFAGLAGLAARLKNGGSDPA